MRLEINTSGGWRVLASVSDEQLEAARDACRLLVNLAEPKQIKFRLCRAMPGGWFAADHLIRRTSEATEWDNRK